MLYNDETRGIIQNPERARQIIDFSGIRFKNITPTDIDGLIEYKNIAYVLMEFKHREAEMPHGQSLALTRMVDDFDRQGKYATLLVCEHYVDDPKADIIARDTNVRRYYYRGKWYPAIDRSFYGKNTYQTVKRFIDMVEKADKLF
jgi:hypothetical protein